MLDVVLICPLSSQPRIIRRAISLDKVANLSVLGFQRRIYETNHFPKDINYQSLGHIEDGHYFRRIGAFIKALFKIRKVSANNAIFYALSIDCLLLAKLAGIKDGIYEIGDLRSCEKPNSIYSRLERFLLRSVRAVVITSDSFYSEYFINYESSFTSSFFEIRNKLDKNVATAVRQEKSICSNGRINIGLVGSLRYEQPIRWLIDFVNKYNKQYHLICHGDGAFRSVIEENTNENIEYFGPYKAPDDLERIYEDIHINFVVYDNSSRNVRLAVPNKLYESIFFGAPILAACDTALANEINKLGVGVSVSLNCFRDFERDIIAFSAERIQRASKAALNISTEQLVDDSERQLYSLLRCFD